MRNVFPFEVDRAAIEAFLRGDVTPTGDDAYLTSTPKGLVLQMSPVARSDDDPLNVIPVTEGVSSVICWISKTDGALQGMLCENQGPYYSMLTLNKVLEMLGIDDRVRRERSPQRAAFVDQWFMGDKLITIGEPLALTGPLTILAFRNALPEG